ncbi:hypothetical protein N9N28_05485 [Rubripirellula amarantea]|nr:hypothetical protein [Rubripirellula amarantea]
MSRAQVALEMLVLVGLFFVYAGDAPPMVNEAHYLVKAKNFWQPEWCANDLFAASGKAHVLFYSTFGYLTQWVSLSTSAWIGRVIGWTLIAAGLSRLCRVFSRESGLPHSLMYTWAVAIGWIAGIEYGNLAGEWVIGGIEAKVPAYGFVLFGIADLIQRRWNRVWVWFGAAAGFHVLTGGWSVVAAMVAWWITERNQPANIRCPLVTRWLVLGGVLSLPGVIPAVQLSMGADPQDSAAAASVYSYFRISHHLMPAAFDFWWYLRHACLLFLLFALALTATKDTPAKRRLMAWTIGVIAIAAVGMLVGFLPPVAPDLAAKLLRYYWFRVSDAIVPLGVSLLAFQTAYQPGKFRRLAFAGFAVAVILVTYSSIARMRTGVPPSVNERLLGRVLHTDLDRQRIAYRDWLRVCQWAKASTPEDEVFLTPRHQQTFKWYAHRAEVVNWKDVPQDAASLLEWKRRFLEVYPPEWGTVRVSINYRILRDFRDRYGVRFLIVDRKVVGDNLPLIRVYPRTSTDNENYAVYELPR